jgi:hypothetical protein
MLYKMVKDGLLTDLKTPGGHRRYIETEIMEALKQPVKKEDD